MTCRPHMLYIWYGSRKWCLLLLVPLLRMLFGQEGAELWRNSIQDTVLALTLISISWMRWRGTQYTLRDGLRTDRRFILRHTVWVLAEDAVSAEEERSLLMAVTGCRRVTVYTAGIRRRADASMLLRTKRARTILPVETSARRRSDVGALPIAIMATSGSNAAVGVLTLAPVARQAARLFRDEADEVTAWIGRQGTATGLSRLFQLLAVLLIGGWGYASLRQWLRFYGFQAERTEETLTIRSGLATRRTTCIDCRKITALELRQSLLTYCLRLYTATITAAGYGRDTGTRPVLVPIARRRRLHALLNRLLPHFPTCSEYVSPAFAACQRELAAPFLWMGSFLMLWLTFPNAFCLWAAAGCAWWMTVRLIGFCTGRFGVDEQAVSLRYACGLTLYEVQIPRASVDCLCLKQSPWQRRKKLCDVTVWTYGEHRRRRRVRGIPYERAVQLSEKFLR